MLKKLTIAGLVLALVACASTDNAEPPTPLGAFTPTVRVESVWTSHISSEVNRNSFYLQPYVSGGAVYVTDHKGHVTAFSREHGSRIWHVHLGLDISAGISGDDRHLYLGSLNGDLIALSKSDGREVWRAQMTTEIIAAPSADQGKVVARSIDGRITLFEATDGREVWVYNHTVPRLTVRGNSPALLVPGGVLAGLGSGKLLALDIKNGKPLWEVTLSEPFGRSEIERLSDIDAPVQIDQDSIFAAGFQGSVARLDPGQGQIRWAREISSIVGFRLQGDDLYIADADS
ncbi:MAG: PQQ-binding-like beta-propeller repeat protein, partial [Pseudomonadota bacterium]